MEIAIIVAVVSVVIAMLSLAFAIYKHFSTRSFARVAYEVSQVSDYGVPESFLAGVSSAPLSLKFKSVGNRKAENLILRLKTRSQVSNQTTQPQGLNVVTTGPDTLELTVPELNPTQCVRLFLNCQGNPAEDQIEELELTHSEGEAINMKSPGFTKVKMHFFFTDIELDLVSSSIKLVKFGPWSFR